MTVTAYIAVVERGGVVKVKQELTAEGKSMGSHRQKAHFVVALQVELRGWTVPFNGRNGTRKGNCLSEGSVYSCSHDCRSGGVDQKYIAD